MPENNPTPPATEPVAPVTPPAAPTGAGDRLPDDHPLVKAFNANKTELADARKKLQEIDDANKTDAQKQADEIAELKKTNAALAADKLRSDVAAAKGVPATLISGTTKAELEKAADDLLAFKGGTAPALPGNQRPAGPVAPVQEHEETKEDRLKRLEGLKR